jgi:signal transduction histidine kinase
MYSDNLVELLIDSCPFPTIDPQGQLRNGLALQQPPVCQSCQDRRCAALHMDKSDLQFDTCYRGMGVVRVGLGRTAIVINGVLLRQQVSRLSWKEKKRLDRWRMDNDWIEQWARGAQQRLPELEAVIKQRLDDSLGMLHDVQTSVSSILRSAEELVQQQPGADFEEKLERLSGPAMNLVKAVQVLQGRLNLMPLLTNPDAARYGQQHPVPIYRVVDRIVRILRSVADRTKVLLVLKGSSFNRPLAYDSFEAIPLILLDNAIKYSRPGQSVEVEINDVGPGVQVAVRSFSPCIPADERNHLFDRGFRGRHASAVASRGSGLGLFLAQTVARAHGSEIQHASDDRSVVVDGVPYCNNVFTFIFRP